MIRLWLCVLVLLCMLPIQGAAENDVEAGLEEVFSWLDFSVIDELRLNIDMEEEVSIKEAVWRLAKGETLDVQALLMKVFEQFLAQLARAKSIIPGIMLPVLLLSVLMHSLSAGNDELIQIVRSAGILIVLISVVLLTIEELEHTKETIVEMTGRMDKLLPMLLTLLTALGGSASSAFLHPMVVAASGSMVFLAREVVLRLVMCHCAVTAVNHLSEREHLSRMARLLRGAVCWLLGVSFTVFLGAMSLQGVCSASVDGVAIRAAKYAVDNFVPIIGGMFSDTMDTLVGCTLIVKNALGIASVFVLMGALLSPLMGTAVCIFLLKLSAALLEPVADHVIVSAVDDFSKTIVLFFVTMLSVATMYFLLIVQMLLVGNLTAMLR